MPRSKRLPKRGTGKHTTNTKKTARRRPAKPVRGRRKSPKAPERRPKPRSTRPTPKGRALDAVAEMRRKGKSLTKATQAVHTTRKTVRKYAASAVGPKEHGRYTPKAYDRLTRPMRFLTPDGLIELHIRSSTSASRIGEFWNAVDTYLRTGRTGALNRFRGKVVRLNGVAYPFVTDPRTLDRLANAGEVRFEDLYALRA